MTASDLIGGIEPGSVEHGQRAALEQGLSAALPDASQTGPNPLAGQPGPPLDSVDDPIAALLSGELDPGGGQEPITSGLSVGPGDGPPGSLPQQDPKKVRLQQIATQARSPLFRAAARNELRRLTGESV